jgi:hypothetical protein
VGEVSLEAIRANLATPKVNQADLMMREPHKCTAEDVRTLVQESRDHGWITMTQQGHGRFLLLCSPVGNVVVLHSATRAYKVPDTLERLLCDKFVHKVCIDSLEIAEMLERVKIQAENFVDADCLAAFYKQPMISPDLDDEVYEIDEGDRPYSNPALFKGPAQWYALQRLRSVTHLVWRLSRLVQGRQASGANVLQWSRGVLWQHATSHGCQKSYPGNPLEEVAKMLKEDIYVCPQSAWATRFELSPEDHQWFEVAKRAVEEEYLTEPDLRKLADRCQKCGREESHARGACVYALREVTCCYPLCQEYGHSIVVCPLMAERCQLCRVRGHLPEHHDEVDGLRVPQQMLEQTFLLYSKMHAMCGSVWYAKTTYYGHWRAFLYGEDPQANPKLLVATGLKAGVSRRELQAQTRRELDLEEIRREAPSMDPTLKALRVNSVLAKYTAALLQVETYRAQLEAYGVGHLAQLQLPSLTAGQDPVPSGSGVAIPQPAAVARPPTGDEAATPGVQHSQDTLVERMNRVIQDRDSGSEGEEDPSAMEVPNENTA